jgi:hypothetical protein
MRRQRAIWAAVALAMAGVPTAEADDLKNMLQQKFQLAEIFEGAAYAAEKCPGLRVIEGNIMATADEAGVPRDNQGETAASIRMRMRRGGADGARA